MSESNKQPKKTNKIIKLYKVLITTHYCGSRIEGYSNNVYIYTDEKKAKAFSYSEACKHANDHEHSQPKERDDGNYLWEDRSYPSWAEFSSSVEEDELDFTQDVILSASFEA